MADYGITSDGFNRKPREQIVDDMISKAENLFGSSLNKTDKNPLIKFIKILSYPLSVVWFALEAVYNSAYVDTAEGQSLDYVAKYIGIERQSATKAVGQATFSGDDGTTVPEGYEIETGGDEPIQFETTESGDISSGGVTLNTQALEAGEEGNVAAETITEIVNPISGINDVINSNTTSGGSDRETDFEFRQRYKNSVAKGGKATIDSIISELLSVDNVEAVKLRVNFTNSEDSDGLPPKSIQGIVYKGVDQDIGQALLDSVGGGIETYGGTSVTVEAKNGTQYTINFTRPSEITIYVDVTVTKADEYPSDGDSQVEEAILDYINNLSISDNVIYTKIIEVVHSITGVEDVDVTIGTSDDPSGTSNISIGDTEVTISSSTEVDVS